MLILVLAVIGTTEDKMIDNVAHRYVVTPHGRWSWGNRRLYVYPDGSAELVKTDGTIVMLKIKAHELLDLEKSTWFNDGDIKIRVLNKPGPRILNFWYTLSEFKRRRRTPGARSEKLELVTFSRSDIQQAIKEICNEHPLS